MMLCAVFLPDFQPRITANMVLMKSTPVEFVDALTKAG